MWPIGYLRWISAVLNVAMIASTPVDGGHYFCDAVAGIAIAMLCWSAARRIVRTQRADGAALLPPTADTPSIVPDMAADGTVTIRSLEVDLRQSGNRTDVTHEH